MKRLLLAIVLVALVIAATTEEAAQTAASSREEIAFMVGSQADGFDLMLARPGHPPDKLMHGQFPNGAFPVLTWSPDGSRLLVSAADGLHVVVPGRLSDVRLTPAPVPAQWSPDSRRISYESEHDLELVNADGSGGRRRIARIGAGVVAWDNAGWSWSPDAKRIVYSGIDAYGRSALFLVNTTGIPHRQRINVRPRPFTGTPSSRYHPTAFVGPVWSPDGSHIAFGWSDGTTACCEPDAVYVIDPSGTHATRLTRGYAVSWSPDGRKLAFFTECLNHYCGLTVAGADGTGLRRICGFDCGPVGWLPDASALAYIARGTREIGIVGLDGARRRLAVRRRAWYPCGFTVSPYARELAYVGGVGRDLNARLYVVRADGSGRHLVARWGSGHCWALAWRPAQTGKEPR